MSAVFLIGCMLLCDVFMCIRGASTPQACTSARLHDTRYTQHVACHACARQSINCTRPFQRLHLQPRCSRFRMLLCCTNACAILCCIVFVYMWLFGLRGLHADANLCQALYQKSLACVHCVCSPVRSAIAHVRLSRADGCGVRAT